MKNKKADLAVTLLVFMAVALTAATSFIFLTSSGKIETKIVDARFIDEIYLTEERINFYINEVMEKSVANTDKNSGSLKEDFVSNFLNELSKYKDKEGYVLDELIQVEQQINDYEKRENVKLENGKIQVELKIKVGSGFQEEKFNAVYTYTKKFEKQL